MNISTKIIEFDGKITVENCVDKIIHGDCLEIMCSLPDKCVDVIITLPPYNLLNSSGNGLKKNTNCGKWKNAAIKNGYAEYDDNMPYAEYIAWQRECVAEMCRIISSTTGQIILDPFAGSGTTAVSAKKFGRNFILIEKSLKYCEIAQKRIDGGDWRHDFTYY